MTYYASVFYKDLNTTAPNLKGQSRSSDYISLVSGSTISILKNSNVTPYYINSNNSILPSTNTSYTGDYSNYVIVNNGSSDWVLTLPLGSGGGTTAWVGSTMQITVKKTGSGILTLQTPADTIGTRIRGINTISNKSYTLSSSSEQTVNLLYGSGKDEAGTTNSTYEIWFVI